MAFESGRLRAAENWARRASREHRSGQGPNWWRLRWLEGRIAHGKRLLRNAEAFLTEARDGFASRSNPFDLALVSLDLARVLLEQELADMVAKAFASEARLEELERFKPAY